MTHSRALISMAIASLLVSCAPKAVFTDRPNTVEITTRPIKKADGEWTEIVIHQTLSLKTPMVVENISDRLADSMQWGVETSSDRHDEQGRLVERTMTIHARPVESGRKIVLTQNDFVFHPSIIGWQPIEVSGSRL
jgi:hypothetical protein